jgi:hypothetical protein
MWFYFERDVQSGSSMSSGRCYSTAEKNSSNTDDDTYLLLQNTSIYATSITNFSEIEWENRMVHHCHLEHRF